MPRLGCHLIAWILVAWLLAAAPWAQAPETTQVRYWGHLFSIDSGHLESSNHRDGDVLHTTAFWIALPDWRPPTHDQRTAAMKSSSLPSVDIVRLELKREKAGHDLDRSRIMRMIAPVAPWSPPTEDTFGLWSAKGSFGLRFFVERDGTRNTSAILCTHWHIERSCSHRLHWREFVVTLMYAPENLAGWRDLERASRRFLDTALIREPSDSERERLRLLYEPQPHEADLPIHIQLGDQPLVIPRAYRLYVDNEGMNARTLTFSALVDGDRLQPSPPSRLQPPNKIDIEIRRPFDPSHLPYLLRSWSSNDLDSIPFAQERRGLHTRHMHEDTTDRRTFRLWYEALNGKVNLVGHCRGLRRCEVLIDNERYGVLISSRDAALATRPDLETMVLDLLRSFKR
jgi:hypothetical protein